MHIQHLSKKNYEHLSKKSFIKDFVENCDLEKNTLLSDLCIEVQFHAKFSKIVQRKEIASTKQVIPKQKKKKKKQFIEKKIPRTNKYLTGTIL